MKIGYDAKRAANNFTGLGNYSRYIISGVSENCLNAEYTLYVPRKSNNSEYLALFTNSSISEVSPKSFLGKKLPSLWRSFLINKQIRRDKIDIYHGLSNELPFGIRNTGVKSIVTIHDVIFLRLPQCYKFFDRLIYNYKFRYACEKADYVVTVSECTKRDIIEFYGINPDKVLVIYQGCNKMFKERASESLKREVSEIYNLPKRFILNVGTLEERKNLFLVVKSLSQLPDDVHIVAVGRRTKYSDMVMDYAIKNNLSSRIHFLHSVKFAHLPAIYQNAEVFAYPSRYEGFGIPIIEAISCGLPVIAATGSCLEEAGGDGAYYVSPDSVDEFVVCANRLLSDKDLAQSIVRKGQIHILKFDDTILADNMIKLYNNVIRG